MGNIGLAELVVLLVVVTPHFVRPRQAAGGGESPWQSGWRIPPRHQRGAWIDDKDSSKTPTPLPFETRLRQTIPVSHYFGIWRLWGVYLFLIVLLSLYGIHRYWILLPLFSLLQVGQAVRSSRTAESSLPR